LTPLIKALILLLFFASGACALIYEVVWTRRMTFVFGVSVYAVSTVLSSFMAGLALGSLYFGRRIDRARRVLPIYAALEFGIGIYALLSPRLLDGLEPLFGLIRRDFYSNYGLYSFWRFLIAFTLLLPPTFMMGGTFPVLSRFIVRRRESLGRDVGALYAINTAGAVAGTFLVGFVMLAAFGMKLSIYIAAAANLAIGAIALALARYETDAPEEAATESHPAAPPPVESPLASAPIVLAAIGLSGFAALGLEVLWARVLVFHLHNSTYAFSAILVVFLLGLALGSWIYSRIAERLVRPVGAFGLMEIGIGLWTLASLWIVGALPRLTEALAAAIPSDDWTEVVAIILAQAAVILLPPTVLMGMTLPLATRLVATNLKGLGARIGGVYSINTLGTVLGSSIVGFVLIPYAGGVRNSFLIVAGINLLVGAGLILHCRATPAPLKLAGAAGALALIALAPILIPPTILIGRYAASLGELRFYKEEATDTIMVADLGGDAEMRTLVFADQRGTAGTWSRMEDRYYGHLPVLLHPDPRDVLVICFGAGNTMGAIGRHEEVESIEFVELSPGVVEAAKFFASTNFSILDDPRVAPHFEDGRTYLLGVEKQYDVIHLDPPELHTAGVVNLYTEEFYELCKRRLKPGGVMSHWFNATKVEDEEMRIVVGTFQKAFPHATVWQGPGGYSWNLIATDGPLRIDWADVSRRIRQPRVVDSLGEWDLNNPARFFSSLLMNAESLRRYSEGRPTITDDMTIVDFTNPKSIHSGFGFLNMYSPARNLEGALPSNPYVTDGEAFRGGGLSRLVELTQETDDARPSIDWTGVGEAERAAAEEAIGRFIEERKKGLRRHLPPGHPLRIDGDDIRRD
jgi:spermidine synthase